MLFTKINILKIMLHICKPFITNLEAYYFRLKILKKKENINYCKIECFLNFKLAFQT